MKITFLIGVTLGVLVVETNAQMVKGKMTCQQVVEWVNSATPEMIDRVKMTLSSADLAYAQRCLRQARK